MKNRIKILIISLSLGLFFGISAVSVAQPSPPEDHGAEGNQSPGGAAPIGTGLFIMMTMGAAYGAKKLFTARKKLED